MATVHANKILTKFMLLLGGHNHCVKVSSDSETVRGMGLWEFSGALRELMLMGGGGGGEICIYRLRIGLYYHRHLKVNGLSFLSCFELLIVMSNGHQNKNGHNN